MALSRIKLLPTYYYLMCIAVNVPGKNTAASKIQLTSKEMSICAAFWSISFDLVNTKDTAEQLRTKPQNPHLPLAFFLTCNTAVYYPQIHILFTRFLLIFVCINYETELLSIQQKWCCLHSF